jgi:branched-chain amino acid transport system permease protein
VFRTWDSVTKGADGLRIAAPQIFGFAVGTDRSAFPVVAALFALVLVATQFFARSKLARSLCAIRESEYVAAASGIDVARAKVLAFAISAVYAGIAGGMYTLFYSYINPDVLGVSQLVLLLTMVVMGGSGSIPGVVVGVVLVGLLPEILRAAPRGLLMWQEFVYGLILILTIVFLPNGIWGLVQARTRRRAAVASPGSVTDTGVGARVREGT